MSGTSAAQTLEGSKTAMVEPLYLIQPNDILQIYVWKDPNLSEKVLVRPDGHISFPLVKDLRAANLTPVQLAQQMEDSLKKYIDVPNVTVIVDAIQSYRVYVTGKVAKPGAISNEKPITVLQAIALAGGFTEFADPTSISIIRGAGEDGQLWKFNYPEVIKGRNFSQNMLLKAGDAVVVP
jgi:polysaccharide export outer membrane protein